MLKSLSLFFFDLQITGRNVLHFLKGLWYNNINDYFFTKDFSPFRLLEVPLINRKKTKQLFQIIPKYSRLFIWLLHN